MDDGFCILPMECSYKKFTTALNNLHPAIKFTVQPGMKNADNNIQQLNFLDVNIILKNNLKIETGKGAN